MESINIFIFFSLLLIAEIPIEGQSVQSLAPGYFGSPSRCTSENLGIKRYVSAGDRAYEVGTLAGAFPQIGWHVKGHMNGVWAPPVKLLNSYQFLINGQPLPNAIQFTSGAGYVEFGYPETNGLQITRTLFAPDGIPAVLVALGLRNVSTQTQSFRLGLEAVSESIADYPWSKTVPTWEKVYQPDRVSFEPIFTGLVFSTPDRPFFAFVSGLSQVANARDSANFVAALLSRAVPQSKQAVGQLIWQITVTAGDALKLWFTIAGSRVSRTDACITGAATLRQSDRLFRDKIAGRKELLALSRVDIPNHTLQEAFDWAKLNLADMRRVVSDVKIRDTRHGSLQGEIYPAPLRTCDLVSGVGASYPDYPWYFGTDGAYTVFSLVAVGQFQAAKEHLRLLREVSRMVNGSTG